MSEPTLTDEEKALPSWSEWWDSLTNAQRYRYYALCNLAYANAMIDLIDAINALEVEANG